MRILANEQSELGSNKATAESAKLFLFVPFYTNLRYFSLSFGSKFGTMNLYKVDQVAELCQLHPKTVRRLIREGKIRGEKFGGQWRISEQELARYFGPGRLKAKQPDSRPSQLKVSAVVECPAMSRDENMRITNTLLAATPRGTRIDCRVLDNGQLKVLLYGATDVVVELLNILEQLQESNC